MKSILRNRLRKLAAALLLVLAGGLVLGYSVSRATPEPAPKSKKADRDPGKSDRKLLQGTWKVVATEMNGVPLKPDQAGWKQYTLTFTGNRATFRWVLNDKKVGKTTCRFTLDAGKNPKEITFQTPIPAQDIYQLDKDDLRLCFFGLSEAGRPKKFATGQASAGNPIIWVLRRAK